MISSLTCKRVAVGRLPFHVLSELLCFDSAAFFEDTVVAVAGAIMLVLHPVVGVQSAGHRGKTVDD